MKPFKCIYVFIFTNISFCRIPTRHPVRDKWIAFIKAAVEDENWAPHSNNTALCSDHFDASCFTVTALQSRRLKSDAVPTIVEKGIYNN